MNASSRAALDRYVSGETSAPVTLMSLLVASEHADHVAGAIAEALSETRSDDARTRARLETLATVLDDNRAGCERIAAMLRADIDSDAPAPSVTAGIEFCRRLFDWSVGESEEASVALYSLGSPAILERATAEIVALLEQWAVLGPDRDILQIGCGIGRLERALSGRVRSAVGIDVSLRMIEAARRRCAECSNIRLVHCDGLDLAMFTAGAFDMVYAVDSFPYLVQSGMALVETHFAEARRVLRPGGDFVVMNFSYRDDPARDRADSQALAAKNGFDVVVDGSRPFDVWDGLAFRYRVREIA